jgi:hypothetical protein
MRKTIYDIFEQDSPRTLTPGLLGGANSDPFAANAHFVLRERSYRLAETLFCGSVDEAHRARSRSDAPNARHQSSLKTLVSHVS